MQEFVLNNQYITFSDKLRLNLSKNSPAHSYLSSLPDVYPVKIMCVQCGEEWQ